MSEPIDYFFTPTGPSWLPDRSPVARREHEQREQRERARTRRPPEPVYPYDPPGPLPWRGSGPRPDRAAPPPAAGRVEPREDERGRRREPVARPGSGDALDDLWASDLVERTRSRESGAEPGVAAAAPFERTADRLREVAVPVLLHSRARLLAFGHDVELRNELDRPRARLVVHLRPSDAPLRGPGKRPPAMARFELRLTDEADGSGGDRTPGAPVVRSGYVSDPLDPRVLPLGSAPADEVGAIWVRERFVDFVERVLRAR